MIVIHHSLNRIQVVLTLNHSPHQSLVKRVQLSHNYKYNTQHIPILNIHLYNNYFKINYDKVALHISSLTLQIVSHLDSQNQSYGQNRRGINHGSVSEIFPKLHNINRLT